MTYACYKIMGQTTSIEIDKKERESIILDNIRNSEFTDMFSE